MMISNLLKDWKKKLEILQLERSLMQWLLILTPKGPSGMYFHKIASRTSFKSFFGWEMTEISKVCLLMERRFSFNSGSCDPKQKMLKFKACSSCTRNQTRKNTHVNISSQFLLQRSESLAFTTRLFSEEPKEKPKQQPQTPEYLDALKRLSNSIQNQQNSEIEAVIRICI
jgi:hypothetical protein